MELLNIPFTKLAAGDIQRPVIIINPHTHKEAKVFGLIDTGADECALPGFYADILGHNLKQGRVKEVNTGDGATFAYSHTVNIKIKGCNFVIQNTLVDFLPNLHTPLRGVKSFLNNFILTIDYTRKIFSLLIKNKENNRRIKRIL